MTEGNGADNLSREPQATEPEATTASVGMRDAVLSGWYNWDPGDLFITFLSTLTMSCRMWGAATEGMPIFARVAARA